MKLKILTISTLIAISLTACDFFSQKEETSTQTEFVTKIEPSKNDGTVGMLLPDFSELVAREGGSVVNIQAIKDMDTQSNNDTIEDPYYEFFKRLIPNPNDTFPEYGQDGNFGSGVIISADGYILTNAHVVKGLNNIKITLNDKRDYQAKLIGFDDQSDIALLKIDANDLPVAKVGNPQALKVGEWVAAIGAPFGFDNSVTAGIVSAKNRALPNENYTPFIQTDVAINPGNSGGPLFNLKGEVVGINSQIYSRSGGFMGISFAIPIDVAINVAEQIKTTGKVERGQIGVIIQEVSYHLAKSFGLEKPTGALITRIIPNSPAAKAGLQTGDIIQSVNQEPVRTSSDLPMIIGTLMPGQEIKLGVWRNQKALSISLTLGSNHATTTQNIFANIHADADNIGGFVHATTGLTVSIQATAGGKEQLTVFRSEGIAAQAGIRRGDVLQQINGQSIHSQADFENALKTTNKNIPVLVERNGNMLFFALVLP